MIKVISVMLMLFIGINSIAQSKQETINWINSKSKHQFVSGDIFKSSSKMQLNADGSFVMTLSYYEIPFNPLNPEITSVTTLKGNLKDFNPASVSIRNEKRLVFIRLDCTSGKDCIKASYTGDGPKYATDGVLYGAFDGNEKDIAVRLKKAFTHLITLCGGKKEVF